MEGIRCAFTTLVDHGDGSPTFGKGFLLLFEHPLPASTSLKIPSVTRAALPQHWVLPFLQHQALILQLPGPDLHSRDSSISQPIGLQSTNSLNLEDTRNLDVQLDNISVAEPVLL